MQRLDEIRSTNETVSECFRYPIKDNQGPWPSYNPGSHTAPATLWSRSNLLERPEQIEHRMQDANAPKFIEK